MGVYINKMPDGTPLGLVGKANRIARLANVEELAEPPKDFNDVPSGKIMVAVVFNPPWEAALICDTKREFDYVADPERRKGDSRPCRYFLLDREQVMQMADREIESEYESRKRL